MEKEKLDLKSTIINVLIENYEYYITDELEKERKKEILDIITNDNKLCSLAELDEIVENINIAYQTGDAELLKIYLSETIQNDSQELTFKIDRATKTASLFKINGKNNQVTIPRTVNHGSTEYLITSISGIGKDIKSIKFDDNSAVKTIYGHAFPYYSKIEEIYFPASLKELKEGWCCGTGKLNKIVISPLNNQFIFKDDKYLLGKSDKNKDEFDVLLFARRDIEEISIPANVLKIGDHAFYKSNSLKKVEISTDSKLEIIESSAFSFTNIVEIYLPANLKELKEGWFGYANNLRKFVISPLNKHFIFKDNKYLLGKSDENKDEFDVLHFAYRDIKEISIPSNIKIISSFAFHNCNKLTKVEIPTNSNLEIIGESAFAKSNITEIFIPPKVTKICDSAFYECIKLTKIEIPPNSNLQIIGKKAFEYSRITEIFIPSAVIKINDDAFSVCNIKKIEFPTDSNLQIIGNDAFSYLKMEEILIPPKVSKIQKDTFRNCRNLRTVKFQDNSILQSIGSTAFCDSTITEIYFPASLRELKEGWCNGANNLKNFVISPLNNHFIFKDDKYLLGKSDENIDEFDVLLFARRDIEEISIPSNIKTISSYSFCNIQKQTKVEIPTNSNLQTIERSAFEFSRIKEIFIPSKVTKICRFAFYNCFYLTKVEIPTDSNLMHIKSFAFAESNIREISIPSKVLEIGLSAFENCCDLTKVVIPENSNLESIDDEAFNNTKIKFICIPSSVSIIGRDAFKYCSNLKIVEITEKSKLKYLPSFHYSKDIIILMPSSLKNLVHTD